MMPEIVKSTTALGIKNIYPGSLEADDVISWLCKNIANKKIIVSVDNDFAQLVDLDTTFYNPIKKASITHDNFEEHFKLTPKEYVYYKAIVGDTSDNISGLDGFGKVKGLKLAKSFANNELDVIAPYKEQVERNLKLVDLSYGITDNLNETNLYKQQFEQLQAVVPDFKEFENICEELEFKSISNNMSEWKNAFGRSTAQALVDFCKMFE